MTNDDPFDIPDFLRVKNRVPLAVKPEWLTKPRRDSRRKKVRYDLPKSMDATGWALLKQIEGEKEEKKKQRFEALKQKKAEEREAKKAIFNDKAPTA
jgi:guanylate kinase